MYEWLKKILRRIYKKSEDFLSGRGLNRYDIVRSGSEFWKSRLKSNFVEVDGHKMFLDSSDSLRLSINGIYEEFETQIVKKIINKGEVVVDIGANIGYYTLIFAKLVGNNGKVFAFEPEPNNFELLKKNVMTNGYTNVELVRKGISNVNETAILYLDKNNKGGHTLIDKIEERESIKIDSIRLDDYFQDDIIDFIKIDVEGFESEAVKGMAKVLQRTNNVKLMTEFSSYLLKKSGIEPIEYLKLLKDFGFNIYNLEKKKKKVVPIGFTEFLQRYAPDRQDNTNLLCLKNPNFEINV